MTVCIAAIANYGQSIVIATDQMLTMGYVKADEAAVKIQGIHANWAAMYAGTVGHVAPVLRLAREELVGREADPTYAEVEQAVVRAYQARLREEQANTVLGRFGMTLDEFLGTGLQKFGDTIFSQLLSEIRQVTLGGSGGLTLLLAGYDKNGGPHIFSVEHPGVVQNHDIQGFWAIGSGGYGALGSLFFHSYNKKFLPEQTVYYVAAAKFMAEKSSDVGETTSLLMIEWDPPGGVLNVEGKVRVRELKDIAGVKQIWKAGGKPRLPKNLYNRMKALIEKQGSTQRAFLGFKEKKE